MPDWFIMVLLGGHLTLVGPFTEGECRTTKALLFSGKDALCIEKRMINDKAKTRA